MSNRPRNVMVTVSGLTPQIITETLWALSQKSEPSFVPDQIVVITTKVGERVLQDRLLIPDGPLQQYCKEYGLSRVPGIDIVSMEEEDIRIVEESIRLANIVVRTIRDLTLDPNLRIHASIAGGRKTMSFYLGYAMSLFGRVQDTMSHVLVAPDFETEPNFYYIPKEPQKIISRTGRILNTADAFIDLVDIPFLRLRDRLDEPLLAQKEIDFATIIQSIQRALDTPWLELVDDGCRLIYGDVDIHLSPQSYAMYKVFAKAAYDQRPGAGPDGVGSDHQGWWTSHDFLAPDSEGTRLFLDVLQSLPIRSAQAEKVQTTTQLILKSDSAEDDLDRNATFRRIRSKLRMELEAKVDDILTRQKIAFVHRSRNPTRFGLAIPGKRIRIK